jgi:hypothetical protein
VFDKGVLTIQGWINKARDSAVEAAVSRSVRKGRDLALAAASRLLELPNDQLNTHILQSFGPGSVAPGKGGARRQCRPKVLQSARTGDEGTREGREHRTPVVAIGPGTRLDLLPGRKITRRTTMSAA